MVPEFDDLSQKRKNFLNLTVRGRALDVCPVSGERESNIRGTDKGRHPSWETHGAPVLARATIERTLQRSKYNKWRAAKMLGLRRKQLYVLLRQHALAWVTFGWARRSDKILWLNETPRGWNSSIRNLAKVMKLSFFSSLTVAETVWALDISERTVKSDWKCAPAWLAKELSA